MCAVVTCIVHSGLMVGGHASIHRNTHTQVDIALRAFDVETEMDKVRHGKMPIRFHLAIVDQTL